jgi:proteasome lid subunit RPN8/RPN11
MKACDLVGFREQRSIISSKLSQSILDQIREISKQKNDQEVCGVIFEGEGATHVIECENLSQNKKTSFILNPKVLIDYDVVCVFHSHCIGSCDPSPYDKKCCEELCIPFIIYSIRDNDFYLYENVGV